MNFDDMFEDVFDDDNFEIVDFEIVDNEAIYNSLVEIFNNKGYDKQLNHLVLACLDFVALKNIYDSEKDNILGQSDTYEKMLRAIAVVNVIIETFIAADDDLFNKVEGFRDEYINNELNKIEFEKNISSNRIAKYLKNNGDLEE